MKWTKTEHYKSTEFGPVSTGHTITTEECNCTKPEPAPSEHQAFIEATREQMKLAEAECIRRLQPAQPSDADKARDALADAFHENEVRLGNVPTKRDAFKAGWDAAMAFMKRERENE